jgi:hypothetical protein
MRGQKRVLRAFTPVFDGLWTRVNALMTRASIFFAKKLLRRTMDCRVKPGNDGGWVGAEEIGLDDLIFRSDRSRLEPVLGSAVGGATFHLLR